MLRLGVNIDHCATLRNARGESYPNLLDFAMAVSEAGANQITAHLREDRRHIKDRDIEILSENIPVPLNLEMAASEEMVLIALRTKPKMATIVPERREEITTEGGLNVTDNFSKLENIVNKLKNAGIMTSLFIEADEKQIESSKKLDVDAIELHTGKYANSKDYHFELQRIKNAAILASNMGLKVHAGHGLDYMNVRNIAAITDIEELNIGFSIVAKSLFIGVNQAVINMRQIIDSSRHKDIL